MKSEVIVMAFENSDVFFMEDGYINATKAASIFTKRSADWLRNNDTKEYILALARICVLEQNQLVIVRNGGKDNGTWIHPKLAIVFARWLSPEFAVWCDQQIEKILRDSEKSSIERMMDNLHKMKVTMCGFDQMSFDERKRMQSVQWEIQGILGLRPKSQVYKRIKMREPLNLLINGISSGQFRRMIGLQPQHRDVDNRPMKTCDFLPQANQYAICKADLYLINFLEECAYEVEYDEACQLYLQYGNMAKIEAERKYQVKLHDSVREIIQSSLDFVQQQLDSDVSPYGQTEQRLEQLKIKLNEELKQNMQPVNAKVA